MPTTTKMGIVYPASTDLVKDGATAMGTISTTVDAKTGLVLINTTSFTTQASVSISDVFSTNYTNYLILTEFLGDAFRTISLRWRVSGADDSNANYSYQTLFGTGSSTGAARTTSQTSTFFGYVDASGRNINQTLVANPFTAQRTATWSSSNSFSTTAINNDTATSTFANTTSFTGFTLIPSAGTITGSVSVYGYNK